MDDMTLDAEQHMTLRSLAGTDNRYLRCRVWCAQQASWPIIGTGRYAPPGTGRPVLSKGLTRALNGVNSAKIHRGAHFISVSVSSPASHSPKLHPTCSPQRIQLDSSRYASQHSATACMHRCSAPRSALNPRAKSLNALF